MARFINHGQNLLKLNLYGFSDELRTMLQTKFVYGFGTVCRRVILLKNEVITERVVGVVDQFVAAGAAPLRKCINFGLFVNEANKPIHHNRCRKIDRGGALHQRLQLLFVHVVCIVCDILNKSLHLLSKYRLSCSSFHALQSVISTLFIQCFYGRPKVCSLHYKLI